MGNSVITTISLTKEQSEAVEKFNLSPSKLLQNKINEIIESQKTFGIKVEYLEKNIKSLQELLSRAIALLAKHGIKHNAFLEEEWA